jgi:hypothetical protein
MSSACGCRVLSFAAQRPIGRVRSRERDADFFRAASLFMRSAAAMRCDRADPSECLAVRRLRFANESARSVSSARRNRLGCLDSARK